MKLQRTFQRVVPLCLMIIALLTGCGSSSEPTNNQDNADNTASNGEVKLADRRYLLQLPANFDPASSYKLLLGFHGSGGTASGMRTFADFTRYSDQYIVAYPQAKAVEWNEGCNCNIAHRLGIDDLVFVDQVIADVQSRYQITTGEVYAAGFSQGALFSQNLACNRSNVFKAIAVVAAPMSTQLAHSCAPAEPVSMMLVMGTADAVLPYHGRRDYNFGLLSATAAVARLAALNNSLPQPMRIELANQNTELLSYSNGAEKTELYSVRQGEHQWRFDNFDTSAEILRFFQQLDQPTLLADSQLIEVDDKRFHVRSMGKQHQGPAVVLLAGPNQNYHSDSAWFALLQPLLAQHYRVYSVDRLGNAWSDQADDVSYRRFAADLAGVLKKMNETDVILVSFASASISARLFYQQYQQDFTVKALLYIDPDVPQPLSLSLYQGYPVDWYQASLDDLLPHLATGAWTERTAGKLEKEQEHASSLIPSALHQLMDWQYYQHVSQRRLLITHQQSRAREIAAYSADLQAYAALAPVTAIPVSVIDTDFETADLPADAEQAARLLMWQQEGTAWSMEQAVLSNGQYIALANSDHLVPLQQPEQIKLALDWLFSQLQLP